MDKGWVKSYRSKWTHPVFRNLLEASIWGWLCDTAAWEDRKVRVNGVLFELKRGQLVTTRRFISKGFCIGEQVTRTFLENLEKEGMINLRTNQQATIITICNYDEYQSFENTANPPTNPQPTHSQPTANPNNKELITKEDKKEEEAIASAAPVEVISKKEKTDALNADFEKLWAAWRPFEMDKGNKSTANKSYLEARTIAEHQVIADGAEIYLTRCHKLESKTKHLVTWLNHKSWEDEAGQSVTQGSSINRDGWEDWKSKLAERIGEVVVANWYQDSTLTGKTLTVPSMAKANFIRQHHEAELKRFNIEQITTAH